MSYWKNSNSNSAVNLVIDVRGAGYPILCLHGHPGFSKSMSVFTERLSRRLLTISPDLRGYGRSQTHQDFAMTEHLVDLEVLLHRLKLSHCLVLGWSLGGILAMELALRFPDLISGLILVATAARPRSNHPTISWQDNLFTGIASVLNYAQPGSQWNIQTFGQRSLYRYLLQQHTTHAYQRLATEGVEAYLRTSKAANRALSSALKQNYDRLSDLENIQCPCLVLAGENDRHITALSSFETAQHLSHAEWRCYPNTAHLFPWEVPDQVLEDIDQWVEAHPQVVGKSPTI